MGILSIIAIVFMHYFKLGKGHLGVLLGMGPIFLKLQLLVQNQENWYLFNYIEWKYSFRVRETFQNSFLKYLFREKYKISK